MHWADAVPNLLIGLREGLEAGLVVSILLAAAKKLHGGWKSLPTRSIWLGVVGAIAVAGSFAAVLTYSTDALSSQAQEAVGGSLSVLAVVLVSAMIFWMRRTAMSLSSQLKGEVARAALIGPGALALTAFLAVGREGLETTLFIWTAAKASGQTTAPIVGAALGILAAVVLCTLLYRRAVKLNLGVFFARTALLLIVIAAGVLAYGLGDLQDAGLLPGVRWVAFDISRHADPNSWWVSLVSGVTDLAPKMTVLQVVSWVVYLGVVIPLFVRARRKPPHPAGPLEAAASSVHGERWARLAGRRTWATAGVMIVVPAALAATTIAVLPASAAGGTTSVSVTSKSCASNWKSGHTGAQTFEVDNKTSKAGEVNLDDASGRLVAEIENIGPGTTADISATLSPGTYTFKCILSEATMSSPPVDVSGPAGQADPVAFKPVTVAELIAPNNAYGSYAAAALVQLANDVQNLKTKLAAGTRSAAQTAWLTAQMDWERVGASYDSFGDYGEAIDGLPDGLPGGVHDPSFVGLHRIEYGLWSGQSVTGLVGPTDTLLSNISTLQRHLTSANVAGDPTQLPPRAHEIIEDALRDHLSGIDDDGAGAAYPETYADLQVDEVVVAEEAALIQSRAPGLLATVKTESQALRAALLATRAPSGQWRTPAQTPLAARQQIDATIGVLLETLAEIPNLLEVPPTP